MSNHVLNLRKAREERVYRDVPSVVTELIGAISPQELDEIVNALMPFILDKLQSRIRVSNDPWGNASLRIE